MFNLMIHAIRIHAYIQRIHFHDIYACELFKTAVLKVATAPSASISMMQTWTTQVGLASPSGSNMQQYLVFSHQLSKDSESSHVLSI